ncbi:MAG: DUF2141 domain-containing protein [Sphingobium sp.]|jgi:uncharacterized protein (DUF2141 family)|nr:DUF2141 domain-containing protein [Sphingobium sp.]MCP5400091.1 DUF2141 domain-containing protein [Sphingomonas sp.]
MRYITTLLPLAALLVPASAHAGLRSTPDLGTSNARCRSGETGPALRVTVTGLKDRQGVLKLEVYPANDRDFLEDDNKLIEAGKVFRRIIRNVPSSGEAQLCVRVPEPGLYAVSILHDRNDNRKFDLSKDGVGFTQNPKLGLSKPRADSVAVSIGRGIDAETVIMNYRRGLFSFGPIRGR